ncbi:MAG: hypothetical protein EBY44_07755 [Actinobacteria bacterium]|nr:hypothetical protein [Actinomycetota bacterium]
MSPSAPIPMSGVERSNNLKAGLYFLDADIVVLANVGVEGRSSIKEIIATITDKRPIEVHAVRHPRSTVPTDDDEINAWLIERWIEMDDWIHHHVLARTTAPEETER